MAFLFHYRFEFLILGLSLVAFEAQATSPKSSNSHCDPSVVAALIKYSPVNVESDAIVPLEEQLATVKRLVPFVLTADRSTPEAQAQFQTLISLKRMASRHSVEMRIEEDRVRAVYKAELKKGEEGHGEELERLYQVLNRLVSYNKNANEILSILDSSEFLAIIQPYEVALSSKNSKNNAP